MVDLVKIRKKAKEKKQASGLGPPASGEPLTIHEPAADKIARFLESAGKRIAGAATHEEVPPEQLELLMFSIAGEMYAAAIEHIVEIVTPRAVTRVPNADPSIVGILSLRGMIVTLIDVRARLGHGPGDLTPDSRVIIIDHDGDDLGFPVDRVLRVVKIDAADLEPHPIVHASEQDESVRGVFRHGEALTILLDLDKLLARTAPTF